MIERDCKTCKWFVPGECRLNPPQVVAIPSPMGQPMFLGIFPPTKPGNYCSKHEMALSQAS